MSESIIVREDGVLEHETGETLSGESQSKAIADLNALGFITPVATPEQLRHAFATKQKLYASILDPSDYLYVVPLPGQGGKTRQRLFTRRDQAEKAAAGASNESYKPEIRATPKKSGIVKLARALGIVAERKLVKGLPEEPSAQYSYVVYEAKHKATGLSEEGVGWCDKTERNGSITTHDCIATADTRAYNRAVLRLSGFGDVSADEIIAGASMDDDELPPYVPEKKQMKKPAQLPGNLNENVLSASRAWAESFAEKGEAAPVAQQATKVARELRAKARRGDETAARQMGEMGLAWRGRAQDDIGFEPFEVDEDSPVSPKDVSAVKEAASNSGSNGEKKEGWDLSGKGSDQDDEPTEPKTENTESSVPKADLTTETITVAQAKKVSRLLMKLTDNDREAAQKWLKHNVGVSRSPHIRDNQYDPVMQLLNQEVGEDA